MKLAIDTDAATLLVTEEDEKRALDLYSPEAFSVLSRLWVTAGWELKYTYGFTWMGRPIIQLPEDMIVVQEVLYRVKPDVVVETGVAHGGSLIFYASLFESMGKGRVIGVDIEIRPHNRDAIESHELFDRIVLIEGSSIDPETVSRVRDSIAPVDTVMVLLDSKHTKDHVLAELDAYAPLVTPGSYLVATDGVMEWVNSVPRGEKSWAFDNPKAALEEWLLGHSEFVLEDPPPFVFNEGLISERVTHWPASYLRRRTDI